MSNSIDERVVEMTFNNREFQTAVKDTLSTLDQLNKGLKLEGASKGLNDVEATASKFSLAGIASSVSSIATKFQDLSVVAITAISSIVNKAVTAGLQVVKAFTFDPVMDGFHNYETQINAIQTILANTEADGTKLADVTKALAELNVYANQTVYNFSEMTSAVGTFTAAGVNLKTSVAAIKGIANLAAISGSNSEQASTAMYQLSQAIAAGTVHLQDWNSVVNAGLGGKTFQNALIETARVNGVQIDKIIKKNGSFRNSLETGWLTSKILTQTLSEFTGDLSEAQLKAMGFTDKEAASIFKMGQTAVGAATKIKTITQLTQALKEEVGTAYAAIFKTIFGDIGQATDLFSTIHTAAENALTAPIYALNNLLISVDKLGGRKALIVGIGNVLSDLGAVLKPIKEAFHEIFPPASAKEIADFIFLFEKFTARLHVSDATANEIKRTFAGLFAIIDLGKQVVVGIFHVLGSLFSTLGGGNTHVLAFTANLGDMLVSFDKGVQKGKAITKFFDELAPILEKPIKLIQQLDAYLLSFFGNFDGKKAGAAGAKIVSALDPLQLFTEAITAAWSHIISITETVWDKFEPIAKDIGSFFLHLGEYISQSLEGVNVQDVLSTLNTGLLAGVVVLIKQIVDKFKKGKEDVSGGFFDSIKETFEGLTGTLKTMQNTLRAATLLEIAAALAILTIAVVALSKIDSAGLTRALTAMSIMFVQLGASLYLLEKTMSDSKLVKVYLITGALSGLAIAVDLLTIAVTRLSKLDWTGLSKGLIGVTVLLGALVVAVRLMPNSVSLIASATGLIILAGAINLLVLAVTDLSGLSWAEMEKGLTGVAGLLVSLALFTKFAEADATGVLSGAGIVLLATGIKLLVSSVKAMGDFKWGEIGRGLASLAGVLVIMGATLDAISPTAPLAAAGIYIVSLSLKQTADVLKQLGDMSWSEIGKGLTAMAGVVLLIGVALDGISPTAPLSAAGVYIVALALLQIAKVLNEFAGMTWSAIGKSLVVLAGSLLIIGAALDAMVEALPGAAAVLVVAGALVILTGVLEVLGTMSWGDIIKGLVALAAVFLILGVAGLALTPVVPTLLALGGAIALLGVGIALAGVGVLAFSAGLTALAISGVAGAAALVGIVAVLIGIIPEIIAGLGQLLIAVAKLITDVAPAWFGAMVVLITTLLSAVEKIAPKVVETVLELLALLLKALVTAVPSMTNAGFKILLGFLNGIANNIGKVVTAGTNIIVNFLNGISNNLPKVLQAGAHLIITFVQSLADTINKNTDAMNKAGENLALAIINGMTGGLLKNIDKVANAAKNMAESAISAAKKALLSFSPSRKFYALGAFSSQGMANGLDDTAYLVAASAEGVAQGALDSAGAALAGVSDLIGNAVDLNPTITPVVDLSSAQRSLTDLNNMVPSNFDVTGNVSAAQNAQNGFNNNQNASTDDSGDGSDPRGGDTIYNQYNSSPKALSSAEIYRNTKNQLSKAKGDLP